MVRGLRGSGALLAASTAFSLLALTQPAAADAARDQWYLGQFNSTTLWQTTKGAGIVVAEVGSGVDSIQVDIAANVRDEVDVSKGYPTAEKGDLSKSYDGTQVAALIVGTGQGSAGVEGLAPNATLMSIRALAAGQTIPASYPVSVGIKYAADHGARVIVLPIPLLGTSDTVKSAVQYAVAHNIVVIASAGNNGKSGNVLSSPCTTQGVLCVSGLTKTGTLWPISSSGSAVDLAAPATDLPVPLQNGSVAINSSTHYSAALAAAEAVLVTSAHPDWTAGQVIRAMIGNTTGGNSGHSRVNDSVGYGTMNPLAAVKAAAPAETTNPFLPIALATASPSASASPKATHSTVAAAPAHNSGGGGSSTVWLAAGGAAAAAILGVGLVWFLIRRRTSGNYLTDPAYGAGSSFLQPDGSPLYYDPQPTYQAQPQPIPQQLPPPPFQAPPVAQPQQAPESPAQQQTPAPQPQQQSPDAYPPLPDWYEQEPPADPGWPAQNQPGGEGPARPGPDAHSPDSAG
jgi:hypothetical protein